MLEKFTTLVRLAAGQGYSDLHISGNHPVVVRKNGELEFLRESVLSPKEIENLCGKLLKPREVETLRCKQSVDLARSVAGVRLRLNAFFTARGLSLAVRFLPATVPSLENLNLHPSLRDFCEMDSGLILFTGATGSGKTTTIASLLDELIGKRPAHVITLEAPIEYMFYSRKAFVQQRELHEHFPSFEQGLVDVLREDPDVLFVGELRDPETIRLTLNAAESGHLVFATMHSSSPEDALYRISNAFPMEAQDYVHSQMAAIMAGVITQQLALLPKLGYRVPHLAILRSSQAVRNNIREKKISQLENTMGTASKQSMFTFERYKTDFLLRKKSFVPPWKIFRASKSEENGGDIASQGRGASWTGYTLESWDTENQTKENTLFPKEKGNSRESGKESTAHTFSIGGEPSLEDVLQELSHTDN
jgi:pilus retraction protein PilT